MANFSKLLLSASTGGRNIPINITGFNQLTTGNLLHSGVFATTSFDEIYLYASNQNLTDSILFIQWVGNNIPLVSGDNFMTVVPAQNGRVLVCDGKLANSGTQIFGLVSGANPNSGGLYIDGYVNRIV